MGVVNSGRNGDDSSSQARVPGRVCCSSPFAQKTARCKLLLVFAEGTSITAGPLFLYQTAHLQ